MDPPRCEYIDLIGFDNRAFRIGEKVCVRIEGRDFPGIFQGYDRDGYRITVEEREQVFFPGDVGKTTMAVAPKAVEQLARQKNVPKELEEKIKGYVNRGGKSRKRKQKKRRNTRRRHS
jgi:hypothetical protein